MKICIITTAFPRWENDSRAPFIFEAAKSLKKLGMDIRIIASHSPGSKTKEIICNIEILRPRYLPEKWENLHKEPGGIPEAWKTQKFGKYAIIPFMISQTITVLIKTKGYDLCHANWTIAGTACLLNYLLFKIPYIVTIQGSDIYKAAHLPIIRSLTKYVLTKAKKIIVLSNSLKNEVKKFDIPGNSISIIPNGVNTQFFIPFEIIRHQIVFFAGSLIKRKGVEYLIKAMPMIIEKNSSIQLVIAGEGNEEINLKELVSFLKIDENVKFLGQITQNQLREWLQISKVFVLPSLEEGQGVVLIEALACGTPCIGSKVGGISDILTEEVGTLIPPADPRKLADTILYYFENEDIWLIKSKKCRKKAVEEYDWDIISKKILKEYKEILRK